MLNAPMRSVILAINRVESIARVGEESDTVIMLCEAVSLNGYGNFGNPGIRITETGLVRLAGISREIP